MRKNKQTKQQTAKLLKEGGMLQEGGTVDPVSGNEVPIGSMQEEVRDDVPAQLSEGEFVIPADVVRFIGLERLMKMRQAAKEGLKKMEAMGQMSNADEATEEDDGEFESEVDDIMGELEVEKTTGEYPEGEEKESEEKKMAVGGAVTSEMNTLLKKKVSDGTTSSNTGNSANLSNVDIIRRHTEKNTPGATLEQAMAGFKRAIDAGAQAIRFDKTIVLANTDREKGNSLIYIMNGGDAKQYIKAIKMLVLSMRRAEVKTLQMFVQDTKAAERIAKTAGVKNVSFDHYPKRVADPYLMTMEI